VHLDKLKREINETSNGDITIEAFSEYNMLREGIEEICRSQDISMIVMGITEADAITETLVGSNSLGVAKHIATPVIIVPHDATYKPIQHILFTCDYKNVTKTVPVALIKNILTATGAHLHVLHVDADAETKEHLQQETILKDLLNDAPADFHTVQHTDFKEAVNEFVAQHNIDLIVAVPKKHGFFEGIFHHSRTKTLAFHNHIPLLLMHEA
jgi:nucleotide-binding universal stress UspA family protein